MKMAYEAKSQGLLGRPPSQATASSNSWMIAPFFQLRSVLRPHHKNGSNRSDFLPLWHNEQTYQREEDDPVHVSVAGFVFHHFR